MSLQASTHCVATHSGTAPDRQAVCVLGATGSIGESTLKVLALHPDRYRLHAVSGFSRLERLAEICQQFRPARVVVPTRKIDEFRRCLANRGLLGNDQPELLEGDAGLVSIAEDPTVQSVMAAIVGAAGLLPTLAAVRAGKRVLLANKESLVMAGSLFMQEVSRSGAVLLPVDSEHNAIFQCLPERYVAHGQARTQTGLERAKTLGVERILLTASGGPFRCTRAEDLHTVTPAQACKHPNWSMGQKISIDSATLMNKGLELIEACHLFDLPESAITVVVHPESIIHSLVQYSDGSTLAQLGNPDMCTPIAHALAWPERIAAGVSPLDLFQIGSLHFEIPDTTRFPCLSLARQAMQQGGSAPALANAANEIAVASFLKQQIGFMQIPQMIDAVLQAVEIVKPESIAHILEQDVRARTFAQHWLQKHKAP